MLTGIINKPLLLHLVGCQYYLYEWCTVKQISDNEIYLLIKYIKSVLWRVAKRLSYIQDARCLKVKTKRLPYEATNRQNTQKKKSSCNWRHSYDKKHNCVRNAVCEGTKSTYRTANTKIIWKALKSVKKETSPWLMSSQYYTALLKTAWAGGSNPGGGEIFRTCLDRPWGPPSLLYNGYRVFPGVKSGRGVTLTPHSLLVP